MKRWIIRSFFIGILSTILLFIQSLVVPAMLRYQSGSVVCSITSSHGVLCIRIKELFKQYYPYTPMPFSGHEGWEVAEDQSDVHFNPLTLGFEFGGDEIGGAGRTCRTVEGVIPFWFPAALLSFLVWGKTRPKAKGRAFPVELAKPNGEQGGKAEYLPPLAAPAPRGGVGNGGSLKGSLGPDGFLQSTGVREGKHPGISSGSRQGNRH